MDGVSDVPMYVVMIGTPVSVSVEDPNEPGLDFELNEIYPNPIAGSATVSFDLTGETDVLIKIYDTMGREVAEVARGFYRAGSHVVEWNAHSLSSGVYYCHMEAEGLSAVRKLVRIR